MKINIPRKTSIIALVAAAALCFAMLLVIASLTVETSRLRLELVERKRELDKTAASHRSSDREAVELRSEIGRLRAQKALYTATIETLSKKDGASK
jgi:predicted  nucleic acid-binding Zn-ribbon protein